MVTNKTFFTLFRRRGFSETIEILTQFPNHEAVQNAFFEKLTTVDSYPNVFFRVKQDLLDSKIIAYKLNEANEKVIYLTDRGMKVWSLIQEIEDFIVKSQNDSKK